jgi:hypothetical protein
VVHRVADDSGGQVVQALDLGDGQRDQPWVGRWIEQGTTVALPVATAACYRLEAGTGSGAGGVAGERRQRWPSTPTEVNFP